MGPFSALSCSDRLGRAVLLGVMILPLTLGCEEEPKEELPTKPWLKDEASGKKAEIKLRTRFEVTAQTTLQVALPTRRSKPVGTLTKVRGHVDFDLQDLSKSNGEIVIALDSLIMQNLPTPERATSLGEAPEIYSDATGEALRWLGLGSGVSAKTKAAHASAVFAFDSLRNLSHPSASAGVQRQSSGGGTARQVLATAEGELSLRGFSVSRGFGATLLFHFPDSNAKWPDTVDVAIRGGAIIPLSEYEIAPRGPDGNLDTKKSAILGEQVGREVHVSGTLHLKRVGGASEGP